MSAGAPDPDTPLRREKHLRIRVGADGIVYVVKHGREVPCGARGLLILDAFSSPMTLRQALGVLEAQLRGALDWMDVTGAILALHRAGVLVDARSGEAPRPASDGSFADPMTHAMMLNDRARTSAFIRAIERAVRPTDVVLDVGTGTGVLAMAAARAGARHVYAVEATGIVRLAAALVEANGLADRVTVVEGWSTEIELPQRADVLVTEIIGEIPLEERLLEATLDARARHLVEGARMIPSRLRILGIPVAIPAGWLASRVVTSETVETWRSWYGLDFTPMLGSGRGLAHVLFVDGPTAATLPALGPPLLLADLDLATLDRLQVATEVRGSVGTGGDLNGVVMFFQADLGEDVILSTEPSRSTSASSWRTAVWFFDRPLSVRPGDTFGLELTYRVPGRRNGLILVP